MENFPLIADFLRPSAVNQNVVRFDSPHVGGAVITSRLFGGQTLAQIQVSIELLYPEFRVLSIKQCFISPGSVTKPIDYVIDRVANTPFLNIQVFQEEKLIITAKAKLGTPEDVVSTTNYSMPNVKGPSNYSSMAELVKSSNPKAKGIPLLRRLVLWDQMDVHPIDFAKMRFEGAEWAPFVAWCTLTVKQKAGKFPDNSGNAVLAFISDFWSVQSCSENYDRYDRNEKSFPCTLSHILTFHTAEPVDPCGWYMAQTECNIHSSNRFFTTGTIFDADGKCVLSFQQEGYKA